MNLLVITRLVVGYGVNNPHSRKSVYHEIYKHILVGLEALMAGPSRIWRRVVLQKLTDVSEEHSASIFIVED
jgi:hypothetical protein